MRLIYTAGTKKSVHISESRGIHKGGGQNKQNSLGGTRECSVKQVVHKGGVFRYRDFTVYSCYIEQKIENKYVFIYSSEYHLL